MCIPSFVLSSSWFTLSFSNINIGNNYEISIKEILKIIRKQVNSDKEIRIDKPRIRAHSTEVKRLYSSNKKAKKLLKWEPKFKNRNGIEKGIKIAIEWYKNPANMNNHYYKGGIIGL